MASPPNETSCVVNLTLGTTNEGKDVMKAKLQIIGYELGSLADVTAFLNALDDLYRGISIIDLVADDIKKADESILSPEERLLRAISQDENAPIVDFRREIARRTEQFARISLELTAVRFSSPGFWEVLGSLNPLLQIREWVNDSHERRKDRQYRERNEDNRQRIELEQLQIKVVSDKVRLLREVGVPEDEIRITVRHLLLYPLIDLTNAKLSSKVVDARIIEEAGDKETVVDVVDE